MGSTLSRSDHFRSTFLLGVALGLFGTVRSAYAEASQAGRVEDRLPTDATRQDIPELRGSRPNLEQAASIQAFLLKRVDLSGCSVFGPDEVRKLLASRIGKTIGAEELAQIAQELTNLYRDRGYFLSRAVIPPQEIQDGILKVSIIEGHIADIDVDGMSRGDALAQFSGTLASKPAKRQIFERELLLLADRPGWSIKSSQLLSEDAQPDRFTLKLKVQLKPVALRLYSDNRGTEANGPIQTLVSSSWNSLFASADRLTASVFVSPADTKELFFADLA